MKVSVYKNKGASVSRFSKIDYDQWDNHSREACLVFFNQYGWKVNNNDGKGSILFNPCDTDLRVTSPSGITFYVECETKKSGFEKKYLEKGIHYTWRKINSILGNKKRDPENTIFITVNANADELVMVYGVYLKLAFDIWPEYAGYNQIQGTKNFVLPEHNCYPLYKATSRGSKPEHFVTIDWDRCSYYTKKDNVWTRVKKSDNKFMTKKT